ncbi:MAG: hypothetical protein ACOZQL_21555 [Myxococcota bacterium]
MNVIYSEPNLVTIEHDPQTRCFVSHWTKLNGPHFRRALEALLAAARLHGIEAHLSDAGRVSDLPALADFQWAETFLRSELVRAGLRRFINVVPTTTVVSLGAVRFGRVAASASVETWQVGSLNEAFAALVGRLAA